MQAPVFVESPTQLRGPRSRGIPIFDPWDFYVPRSRLPVFPSVRLVDSYLWVTKKKEKKRDCHKGRMQRVDEGAIKNEWGGGIGLATSASEWRADGAEEGWGVAPIFLLGHPCATGTV